MKREHNDSRLPQEYTELERVYLDGSKYVDTGLKANLNTRIVISDSWSSSNDCPLFGIRQNGNTYGLLCWENINTGSTGYGGFQYWNGNSTYRCQYGYSTDSFRSSQHELDLSNKGYYLNGEMIGSGFTGGNAITQSGNLVLFGLNNGGSIDSRKFYGYCYYAMVYIDGNDLTLDYVPAQRLSDGKNGLYECINNTFIEL